MYGMAGTSTLGAKVLKNVPNLKVKMVTKYFNLEPKCPKTISTKKTKVLKKDLNLKFNTSVTLCQWLKCEHDYVHSPSVYMFRMI